MSEQSVVVINVALIVGITPALYCVVCLVGYVSAAVSEILSKV